MPDETAKLKLGKGVAFVKTRLRQLRLNDDIWEAEFGLPDDGVTWLGPVVCTNDIVTFMARSTQWAGKLQRLNPHNFFARYNVLCSVPLRTKPSRQTGLQDIHPDH